MKRLILLLLVLVPGYLFGEDVELTALQVEYAETPLGIDVARPRFSWQMQDVNNVRGLKQTAYRIVVKNEAGRVVWDSRQVTGDVSLNIEYAGLPLTATTRYNWALTVWDNRQTKHTAQSWFETGLMDTGTKAWGGAKWIGGGDEDMVLYAQYLPVFKIDYTLQLTSGTAKAGFLYGANDARLMSKYKNIYHLENKKDESYIKIELDVSKDTGMLHIYRVGYHPDDKINTPFKSYAISTSLINSGNKYSKHAFHISSVHGRTIIHIDGQDKASQVADININPMGNNDVIVFPVLADIGYAGKALFADVQIRNYRSPSNLLARCELPANATFTTMDPSRNSSPMLRTAFTTGGKKISKARLYVTARGIYEMYLNSQRIGNDYFNPGHTQYNKTQLYQVYDLTAVVQPGKNNLGAILAEGWWSGAATYQGEYWNNYGDRQSLLAKLVITYADGSTDVVTTNPGSWEYAGNGPLIYGSFFQGEVYDARRGGLAATGITWKPASEIGIDGHIAIGGYPERPASDDFSKMKMLAQFGEPVKAVKELVAQSVEEVRPGVFVYDMGQNMVGVPRISLSKTKPGTTVTLRYAEVKYPDLPEYTRNTGELMLENIRAAMAQDIYITKGEQDTIAPRFTFHGYRFVEITGMDAALPPDAVKGIVLSSVHKLASQYETSNPKVNKLWQNITWSTMGNFLSIPTDCPQRNERLGWSGDISVFARTATYLANVHQFFRRHMQAMRDVQREDGRFTDVAPMGGGFGSILWGSAGITVAWESYLQYADKRMLAEHYDAMKKYIQFIQAKYFDPKTGILVQENPSSWANLGDWLGPEQGKNDNSLLWEAYYIFDLDMMKKAAAVLNKKEDAQYFNSILEKRRQFFNDTYVDNATQKTVYSGFQQDKKGLTKGKPMDTQTSYVLPLAFNVYNEKNRKKSADNLVNTITRENVADDGKTYPAYSLLTGFIGTAWINKALSENGHTDVAYRLLQQTTYPSWLYPVEQGATTIWERLNSYTHTNGFGGNNGMNSFNHYSFGAVGAWMYNHSLGIRRDETSPGFKRFILQPEPDPTGEMTFAKGYYDSPYGRIDSRWEKKGAAVDYYFSIPANTVATLRLDAAAPGLVTENGKPLSAAKGVKYITQQQGKQVFELQSGTYHVQADDQR
ncbi:alpha-L-rhamnosidase [uncultured Chitinophaga sp.]|uniref:alpha-L-rhamnosidase n=1 Tax=uncultured Chitinophaga sp. TaxID=339340 RepID=UPI0025DF1768|nr:alpha-L-rhamnosidase [uncultured Chitinophaga sp.]